jgi:hypothetical protein
MEKEISLVGVRVMLNDQGKVWLLYGGKVLANYGTAYFHLGYKHWSVAMLIANTFLPNPNNFVQVRHKNGDKGDNKLSNLEWRRKDHSPEQRRKDRIADSKRPLVQTRTGYAYKSSTDAVKVIRGLTARRIENQCNRFRQGKPLPPFVWLDDWEF